MEYRKLHPMTVMIAEFFGLPHSLVRTGKLKRLNGTAVSLLVALWHESERTCTRELTRTDKQLKGLVKGHRNSLTAARRELKSAGLVIADPPDRSARSDVLLREEPDEEEEDEEEDEDEGNVTDDDGDDDEEDDGGYSVQVYRLCQW